MFLYFENSTSTVLVHVLSLCFGRMCSKRRRKQVNEMSMAHTSENCVDMGTAQTTLRLYIEYVQQSARGYCYRWTEKIQVEGAREVLGLRSVRFAVGTGKGTYATGGHRCVLNRARSKESLQQQLVVECEYTHFSSRPPTGGQKKKKDGVVRGRR